MNEHSPFAMQVVQEYERAVIFRLGRLLSGGSRGPGGFAGVGSFLAERSIGGLCELSLSFAGIFFVLPCIESYQKVDLRTITLGVPPQEVSFRLALKSNLEM